MRRYPLFTLMALAIVLTVPLGWAASTATGYVPENVTVESVNISNAASTADLDALVEGRVDSDLDRLVTVTFSDTPLATALQALQRQMGINFLYGDIPGRVTCDLRDVPLRYALDAILASNGLGYIVEPGGYHGRQILRIVPRNEIQPEAVERQTMVRILNWQTAGNVETILEDFITAEGDIRSDASTNSVIVSDVPMRVEEIDALIDQIDIPERQVMIEARLVDMTENAARGFESNLGIGRPDNDVSEFPVAVESETAPGYLDNTGAHPIGIAPNNNIFNDLNRNSSVEGGSIAADALGIASAAVSDPNAIWTYGTNLLGYDISMMLEAFEERGMARVLAAPRVTTLNNIPAEIEILREEPYTESTFNPGGQTTQSVLFKEVGLNLVVTPRISNNGFIRMELQPEQTILVDRVSIVGSLVPVVARRRATTNVIVQDQHTAMLGGLRQLESVNSEDGVPWFHQLPVFGFLFGGESYSRDRTDFYIFVTPTVVQDPLLEAAERFAHDLLDLEWDLPQDYFFDDMRIEPTW